MNKNLYVIVALFLFVSGCPSLLPSSRPYQPLPKWEKQFFDKARCDIFPNDVRTSPDEYAEILLVWTGIIKDISFEVVESTRVARFKIEHHYFDWIEDSGIQRETFFLSPRGEGIFKTAWPVDTPDNALFIEQFEVGDMIVAYGYPALIEGEVVRFYPTVNMRAIKPKWFSTDVLDYGRP